MTSPHINQTLSYLQIYHSSNTSMGKCTFNRSSTALMVRAYRLSCVITWRKNYVSILLKLHGLDTQSVKRPCIQTQAANIQVTVSDLYWLQITYNKVWAALIIVMTMTEWSSFFATFKKELPYRIPTYRMKILEIKSWIFKYVFTYYNAVRIYTSNPSWILPADIEGCCSTKP